jgi:hypothetical protein
LIYISVPFAANLAWLKDKVCMAAILAEAKTCNTLVASKKIPPTLQVAAARITQVKGLPFFDIGAGEA